MVNRLHSRIDLAQICVLQSTDIKLHSKAKTTGIRVGEKIGYGVINQTLPSYPRLILIKTIENNSNNLSKI